MCVLLFFLRERYPYVSHVATGDFYVPAFQCPHRVERIGQRGDGGKWVCGIDRVARQDKCVIYSFGLVPLSILSRLQYANSFCPTGVNDDSSYESTLLKRAPGCEIWGYDYSVHGVRVVFSRSPSHNMYSYAPVDLCSGVVKLTMTPTSASGLTFSRGRWVEAITIRTKTFTNIGSSIHS
jgi:hypothetical protein